MIILGFLVGELLAVAAGIALGLWAARWFDAEEEGPPEGEPFPDWSKAERVVFPNLRPPLRETPKAELAEDPYW